MFKFFTFFFLLFVFVAPGFAQDRIIAIVNNDVITQKDLNDFITFMRMELGSELEGQALEDKINSMKDDLLNKLIEDRLILQEAKKEKISVEEARVKAKIGQIKKRYNTGADFQRSLMRQGLVQADIETRVREQLTMYAFIERKIKSAITIKPSEINAFYDLHTSEFISKEERILTMIKMGDEKAAKSVFEALKSGKTLNDLEAKFGFEQEKMSVYQKNELREDIAGVVFDLKPGEFSAVLKVEENFYIFNLDNIVSPRQLILAEVKEQVQGYLLNRKMQEAMAKLLDELRSHSYIDIKGK